MNVPVNIPAGRIIDSHKIAFAFVISRGLAHGQVPQCPITPVFMFASREVRAFRGVGRYVGAIGRRREQDVVLPHAYAVADVRFREPALVVDLFELFVKRLVCHSIMIGDSPQPIIVAVILWSVDFIIKSAVSSRCNQSVDIKLPILVEPLVPIEHTVVEFVDNSSYCTQPLQDIIVVSPRRK